MGWTWPPTWLRSGAVRVFAYLCNVLIISTRSVLAFTGLKTRSINVQHLKTKHAAGWIGSGGFIFSWHFLIFNFAKEDTSTCEVWANIACWLAICEEQMELWDALPGLHHHREDVSARCKLAYFCHYATYFHCRDKEETWSRILLLSLHLFRTIKAISVSQVAKQTLFFCFLSELVCSSWPKEFSPTDWLLIGWSD